MACNISMFNKLTGTGIDTNGNWFAGDNIANLNYGTGVNAATPPGSFSSGSFSVGNQIASGPYLFINPDAVVAGTYDFEYRVGSGSCQSSAIITVTVVDGADAGTAITGITWCNDDATPYNLYTTLLGGSPDNSGTWSGSGTANPAYDDNSTAGNPTDDTFTPNQAGVVSGSQNFTFIYTVNNGGDANCVDNCVDTTTVTVTVAASGNAGGNNAITLCNAL